MSSKVWTALAVFAAACGESTRRAGPIDGTWFDRYITETAVEERPRDLADWSIVAYGDDGAGGTLEVSGVGNADGTFSIPEVPAGDYWLEVEEPGGVPVFTRESSGAPARFSDFAGRADAIDAIAGTRLSLNVDLLAPWQTSDLLVLYSPGAGTILSPGPTDATGFPAPGATDLDAFSIDFRRFGGQRHLIDGSRGDVAYFTQLTTRPAMLGDVRALARSVELPSFSMTGGATTDVTATFEEVPQQSIALRWSRSRFVAARARDDADLTSSVLAIRALPRWRQFGAYGAGAPDLLFYAPPAGVDDVDETFEYGDPFPAEWDRFVVAAVYVAVDITLPSTFDPTEIHGSIGRALPLDDVGTDSIEPAVHPVESPTIEGLDARMDRTGVTATPTLAWDPPAVGDPDRYVVALYRIYIDGAAPTLTLSEQVAVFETPERTVRFPPGVLAEGEIYAVDIQAIDGRAWASMITATFAP